MPAAGFHCRFSFSFDLTHFDQQQQVSDTLNMEKNPRGSIVGPGFYGDYFLTISVIWEWPVAWNEHDSTQN